MILWSADESVLLRQQASIQLKNLVGSQWKSKAKTSEDQLVSLRNDLLLNINEPDEIVG